MRKSYAKFSYGVRKIRIQCEKFAYSAKKYFSCARRWLSHKTSSWSDTWSFVLSVRAPIFGIFERNVLFLAFLAKLYHYSAKNSHTVRKSIFLVQDVGHTIKQVHGQIRGPLFRLSVRRSFESLSGKCFFFAFLAKLFLSKKVIPFA